VSWARSIFQWLIYLSLLLLMACGTVNGTRVPAELTPIETTLTVHSEWSRSVGDGVDDWYLKLNPALGDDTIYMTDWQGTVSALKIADGEPLWQKSLDVSVVSGLQRGDGSLFLGTEDGVTIAISEHDGHELWRRQLSSEVMALSDANLGVVVARTADSNLYGLDAGTGELLWQAGRTTPVLNLRGASKPVVGSGRIVVGFDDGKLVALSPVRGNVLWTTTIANPTGISELERLVDIDGALRLVDGIIYVAAYQGRIAAVTLSEGRILWARRLSSYMGLDVDARRVYVTDADGYIWALDRHSGATLWEQEKLKNRGVTAPVAIGDYIVVGDFEGYTHWLSKYDGHFVARTRVDDTGILTTPIVMGDTAYILDRGGLLAALNIAAQEKALSSRHKRRGLLPLPRAIQEEPFSVDQPLFPDLKRPSLN
jgi:outer membrane protein assembly factor BamB